MLSIVHMISGCDKALHCSRGEGVPFSPLFQTCAECGFKLRAHWATASMDLQTLALSTHTLLNHSSKPLRESTEETHGDGWPSWKHLFSPQVQVLLSAEGTRLKWQGMSWKDYG